MARKHAHGIGVKTKDGLRITSQNRVGAYESVY